MANRQRTFLRPSALLTALVLLGVSPVAWSQEEKDPPPGSQGHGWQGITPARPPTGATFSDSFIVGGPQPATDGGGKDWLDDDLSPFGNDPNVSGGNLRGVAAGVLSPLLLDGLAGPKLVDERLTGPGIPDAFAAFQKLPAGSDALHESADLRGGWTSAVPFDGTPPPAPLPEPSGVVLLTFGAGAFALRRR